MKICCLLLLGCILAIGVAGVDYSIEAESDRDSHYHSESVDDDSPFENHAPIYMRGNAGRCGQYRVYKVCAIRNGMQITKGKGKPYTFYFRRTEQIQQIEFYKNTTTLEHHKDAVLVVMPQEMAGRAEIVLARTKNPKRLFVGTRYGYSHRDQIAVLEPRHRTKIL